MRLLKPMVGAVFTALVLASGPAAAQIPAGWTIVKSPKPLTEPGKPPGKGGQCQMAVPHDWSPPENAAMNRFGITHMNSPRNAEPKGTASVYETWPGRPFDDARKGIKLYDEPTRIFEDSARRFWYRSQASNSIFTVWVVVVAANPVCAVRITFTSASMEDTARKIALSLGPL